MGSLSSKNSKLKNSRAAEKDRLPWPFRSGGTTSPSRSATSKLVRRFSAEI
jgi:hypothetical protein